MGRPDAARRHRACLTRAGRRAAYYAIQVFSGALGTKGGPATDTHARVLDVDGNVITSQGAGTAMLFALEIVRHYLGDDAVERVRAGVVL